MESANTSLGPELALMQGECQRHTVIVQAIRYTVGATHRAHTDVTTRTIPLRGHMNTSTPAEAWHWLATNEGLTALDEAAQLFAEGMNPGGVNTELRRRLHDPAQVAAILTQHALREKATRKFGPASHTMLFTQAGLEQASRHEVAAEHARRFSAAGLTSVTDLGCGVGAESKAFAQAGLTTTAVDIDELTAKFAAHNLADFHNARVEVGDATRARIESDAVFFDPARRTAGHSDTRRVHSDDYSPALPFIFETLDIHPGGVKLGPGFDRVDIPDSCEASWVSVDGSVVEMSLWFGGLNRRDVTRSALVIRHSERFEIAAANDALDAETRDLGEYLYEPDGAVIRARLIGKLASQIGAGMIHPQIAYMTSDELQHTPFARVFRVRESLPAREKDLQKALRARNIGSLEIKKRGSHIDPAVLRKKLKLTGDNHAVLIMTRIGQQHVALLADRVDS